jgi:hypothetical protein
MEEEKYPQTCVRPSYSSSWKIAVVILILIGVAFSVGMLSQKVQLLKKSGVEQAVNTQPKDHQIPPSVVPTSNTLSGQTPFLEESPVPSELPQREIVKGSTPGGVELYEKIDRLRSQGRVKGKLCTEYDSDPIVDVNPDGPSVQLSLMYPSIKDGVKKSDQNLILNDFKVIKAFVEQDKNMILPEYGTLRLFVLTFHDSNCIAKGELEQLMIDNEPKWVDWK